VQGDEEFDRVPNSEIVVSRAAHRNNSSTYYLNDKKSTFTEVTNFLKLKGVDLNNNRFLILQVSFSH
jgi:structural maintenance of chromosome 4